MFVHLPQPVETAYTHIHTKLPSSGCRMPGDQILCSIAQYFQNDCCSFLPYYVTYRSVYQFMCTQ